MFLLVEKVIISGDDHHTNPDIIRHTRKKQHLRGAAVNDRGVTRSVAKLSTNLHINNQSICKFQRETHKRKKLAVKLLTYIENI